ncbi:hypothetical protein ACU8KH_01248 [Lachancea thermotolerans]
MVTIRSFVPVFHTKAAKVDLFTLLGSLRAFMVRLSGWLVLLQRKECRVSERYLRSQVIDLSD